MPMVDLPLESLSVKYESVTSNEVISTSRHSPSCSIDWQRWRPLVSNTMSRIPHL